MKSPRIIAYEPRHFDELLLPCQGIPSVSALRHRSFVDSYYASSDLCRLFLLLDEKDNLVASEGIEWMNFQIGEVAHKVGALSSFYSFRPGFGFYAAVNWLKSCDAGLAYGATGEGNRLVSGLKWTSWEGLKTYCFNLQYLEIQKRPLRKLLKTLLNRIRFRTPIQRLAQRTPADLGEVRIEEEISYEPDLLDFESAFPFRFAPDIEHLAWRYDFNLPFVKYRLFRAFSANQPVGYVILQDMPHGITISHSDGSNPRLLAAATLKSVAAVANGPRDERQVTLISSQPAMQQVFEAAGFRVAPRRQKTFFMGSLRGSLPIPYPVSQWLVNLDWADRGLRRPFLDEASASIRNRVARNFELAKSPLLFTVVGQCTEMASHELF